LLLLAFDSPLLSFFYLFHRGDDEDTESVSRSSVGAESIDEDDKENISVSSVGSSFAEPTDDDDNEKLSASMMSGGVSVSEESGKGKRGDMEEDLQLQRALLEAMGDPEDGTSEYNDDDNGSEGFGVSLEDESEEDDEEEEEEVL
jgi:hypothetical protein